MKKKYMSSLPPAPAFYHEEPRVSFFSRIMADRFNKVGNCCGITIALFGVLVQIKLGIYV